MKFNNKAAVAVAGVGSLLAATAASAAAVDTTAIIAVITDAGTAAAAIGAAVLAMHYGIKLWKWMRGAG